jgi:HAD superfamily hydrolase (TIGR01549 family)
MVEAVVFDVGETLVDETRAWSAWADRLGVPRLTFLTVLGAVLARGGSHREVFEIFRPGYDIDTEWPRLVASGEHPPISTDELYPDAVQCLQALARDGYRLGIAANQPATTAQLIDQLPARFDVVGISDTWGLFKPDPAFFARIASELDLPPASIAYVGDRLDNDVRPARAAGMVAVFVRRGPWGWIHAPRGNPEEASIVVEDLAELPVRLRESPFARRGS